MSHQATYSMPLVRPLTLEYLKKGRLQRFFCWLTYRRKWRLEEDFHFFCPVVNRWAVVPKGFEFDFASVPKAFHWLLSPTGLLLMASIPHDYLYRYGGLMVKETCQSTIGTEFLACTRQQSDLIFLKLGASHLGGSKTHRLAWFILRLFGWCNWKGDS